MLKLKRVLYMLKMQYRSLLFRRQGEVPDRGLGFN